MRALVTGATGFIGRHLVAALLYRGWEIVCMTRTTVTALDSRIRCVQGDLLDPGSVLGLHLGDPVDVLFHLAAQLPAADVSAAQCLIANGVATTLLLDVAAELNVKSIVYASSLPVIGIPEHLPITEYHPVKPTNPYHLGKLCGELACEIARRSNGRRVTSLRITSPYGIGMPTEGVLARFSQRALHSEDIQWHGTGSRAQNFIHVSDVVAAALLAAETESPGVYNIGGAETIAMDALARLAVRLVPESRSKVSSSGAPDPEEGCRWEVDLTQASSGLGYQPKVSLEQGLQEYLEWLRSRAPIPRWWGV